MGEGAGAFLLKRLADAERDGDKIYAVIRGVGGSSDGKGKGITAPNPIGQILAIERAWENAGLDPATATLSKPTAPAPAWATWWSGEPGKVFGGAPHRQHCPGLGQEQHRPPQGRRRRGRFAQSRMALHHKILPPTLNAEKPNPNVDFSRTPFTVNHDPGMATPNGDPRRCGVSAYGFGGTNFHLVLEEHVPGMLTQRADAVFTGVPCSQATRHTRQPDGGYTRNGSGLVYLPRARHSGPGRGQPPRCKGQAGRPGSRWRAAGRPR
jgi:hypothetical protein